MSCPVHLDFNATTPCDSRVVAAMLPFFTTDAGNTSSLYGAGRRAHDAVVNARRQVAELIEAHDASEVVFTSCGTESNTLALVGAVRAQTKRHVVISSFEHPAISEPAAHLVREFGCTVTHVPVSRAGFVSVGDVMAAVTDDTAIVSIMLANNEVGTIQPIAEIGALLRARGGVVFHTDAAQAVGKIPVSVNALGVDLLTIVGHKLYAPKGVGCLYVRRGTKVCPITFGGGQEGGLRPGTLNVPYIVALGEAARIAKDEYVLPEKLAATAALRDRLFELIRDGLAPTGIVATRNSEGGVERCLPNTLSVALHGVVAPILLHKVQATVEASAGAACHTDGSVSLTLQAMGLGALSTSTLRLSLGRTTTLADVERAAQAIVETAPKALPKK
jgi:cysteine desulfurase